jgi:hypothetical protein
MDRMFTTVVKLERKEQKSPTWHAKYRNGLRHFPRDYYKSSPRWFVVGETKALVRSSKINTMVYVVWAIGAQYPISTGKTVVLLYVWHCSWMS